MNYSILKIAISWLHSNNQIIGLNSKNMMDDLPLKKQKLIYGAIEMHTKSMQQLIETVKKKQ